MTSLRHRAGSLAGARGEGGFAGAAVAGRSKFWHSLKRRSDHGNGFFRHVLTSTLEALAVLHALNITHRDLKPSNILLDFPVGAAAARRSPGEERLAAAQTVAEDDYAAYVDYLFEQDGDGDDDDEWDVAREGADSVDDGDESERPPREVLTELTLDDEDEDDAADDEQEEERGADVESRGWPDDDDDDDDDDVWDEGAWGVLLPQVRLSDFGSSVDEATLRSFYPEGPSREEQTTAYAPPEVRARCRRALARMPCGVRQGCCCPPVLAEYGCARALPFAAGALRQRLRLGGGGAAALGARAGHRCGGERLRAARVRSPLRRAPALVLPP
eukprot:scaffold4947_cov269-Prasinococcus_capsulatus_cf.AAC.2